MRLGYDLLYKPLYDTMVEPVLYWSSDNEKATKAKRVCCYVDLDPDGDTEKEGEGKADRETTAGGEKKFNFADDLAVVPKLWRVKFQVNERLYATPCSSYFD